MATLRGIPALFGIQEWVKTAPITNIPDDCKRVKLVMRPNKLVAAYVKTQNGIAAYRVQLDGEKSVKLWGPIAMNVRKQ